MNKTISRRGLMGVAGVAAVGLAVGDVAKGQATDGRKPQGKAAPLPAEATVGFWAMPRRYCAASGTGEAGAGRAASSAAAFFSTSSTRWSTMSASFRRWSVKPLIYT